MPGSDSLVLRRLSGDDGPFTDLGSQHHPQKAVSARLARRAPVRTTADPPFVGRTREIGSIRRALQRAAEGNGSLWSVTGPAGIGKSRLLIEVGKIASRGGFEVRWAVSTWEGQTPLFPYLGLLRDDSFASDLGGPRPRIRSREADPSAPPARGKLRDAHSPDFLALDILEAIDVASDRCPQLVLIDDYHRSDPDSIRFLKLLARNIANRRVLVGFSYRAESSFYREAPRKALNVVVRELRIAGSLHAVELGPLAEPDMVRLAGELVGTRAKRPRWGPAVLSALARGAGGNPYFLRELVSSLGNAPLCDRADRVDGSIDPGMNGPDFGLPHSIQDLLARRLSELPDAWRPLIAAASIVGESFRLEDVLAVVGRRAGQAARHIEGMADAGWPIRRLGPSKDRFAFQHTLLRRAALDLMSGPDRRRFSGRLALFYQKRRPEELESIAQLFAESDRPAGGRKAIDELIVRAVSSRSYGSLDTYLGWKAEILGSSAEGRAEFHRSFVALLRQLRPNYPSDFRALCERYLESNPAEPERSLVVAWKVYALCPVDRKGASAALADLTRAAAADPAAQSPELQTMLGLCQIHLWLDQADAKSALKLAGAVYRDLARRRPSLELLIVIQGTFNGLIQLNRIDEAREWLARGRRVARSLHLLDTVVGLNLKSESAVLEWLNGHVSNSVEIAVDLAERYETMGAYARAALAWYNAGTSRMSLSDPEGARRSYLNALRLARRWGLTGMEGSCYAVLGQCSYRVGRVDEAEAFFRRAIPLLPTAAQSETFGLIARCGLARILVRRGDLTDAKEQLSAAETLGKRTFTWAQPDFARTKADWMLACGDIPSARRLLQRSLVQSGDAQQRYERAETCLALSHLEVMAGRPSVADRWEARAREEAARAGPEVNVDALLARIASERSPLPSARADPRVRLTLRNTGGSTPRVGVSERVVRALSRSGAISGGALDCDVVPPGFTQAGLATQLGLPRESFVRGLLRLVERGAVIQVRRRIEGSARAQKAYLLTPLGVRLAA
jgi:tetratricopeptide (TPR) repeat protein